MADKNGVRVSPIVPDQGLLSFRVLEEANPVSWIDKTYAERRGGDWSSIGEEVIGQVKEKIAALEVKNASVRSALIYEGALSPSVKDEGFFDALIPFERLLRGA